MEVTIELTTKLRDEFGKESQQ
ncbi:uncharacterized protein G2W53_001977 [Senna tora]|uniref:Uncharacterized protein n=1 Tax=Senna tora TaxID=362788 RepID=A0A835CN16_9FABA|nr:uncharacterized protein G2W53_001977 [Senna tora]